MGDEDHVVEKVRAIPAKLSLRHWRAVAPQSAAACSTCGRPLNDGDAFCTYCGEATDPPSSPELVALAELPPEEELQEQAPGESRAPKATHRRLVLRALIPSITIAAVVATGVLAYKWQDESAARGDAQAALATALSEINELERTKAALELDLANARELASKQGELLTRAQKILRQVEPLLSSVDELQVVTGKMQDARESYASASEDLKADLIALASYMVSTSAYYIDWTWVNYSIDEINSEISTVNYYGSTLYGYDGDYVEASTRFSNRADGFAGAVRAFQRQLQDLGGT